MSDTAQLREALLTQVQWLAVSLDVEIPDVVAEAFIRNLRNAQMEAGALIITPDADGTCSMPLWNLGMEAREVEPQPCGMPGEFNLGDQVYCHQCIGDALRDAMPDGET